MFKVLFVSSGTMTSASSRYRVYQYLEPLRRSGFQAEVLDYPRLTTPLRRLAYFAHLASAAWRADVVLIQKRFFPRFLPLLHRLNSKIVYDFDDALFAGPSAARQAGLARPKSRADNQHLDMTLRLCRHVVAGNKYLAAYACRINPNVTVIPTVVDISRYPVRLSRRSPGAPITLGWVGNSENLIYLQDLAPVLVHLTERLGEKIRLHVISDRQPEMPGVVPLHFQPWRLESEVGDLFAFDIGLMPLIDNDWTRGKCAFKAIQYMALGIPTVASPVGANKELIEHNVNGLLASNKDEWIESLTRLIHDGSLRHKLGMAGRQTVIGQYSLEVMFPRLIGVLHKVMER